MRKDIDKFTYHKHTVNSCRRSGAGTPAMLSGNRRKGRTKGAMDDIHNMPGHLVRRFQQIAVAIFMEDTAHAGFDLTPVQYAALEMTAAHPGLDQATLAGLIAYDRSTIGGVVDRLVQKGYVVRQISDRDRRARELRLAAAGRQLLDNIRPIVQQVQDSILSGLNSQERRMFMSLLHKATTAANERSRAPLRTAVMQDIS